MAKHILENELMTFTMSYRAVCKSNDYRGPWRSSENQALRDALEHQREHIHEVMIEVMQSQSMLVNVNQTKLAALLKSK